MGTTPNGIWYPESGASTRIWELMRQQAESIDQIKSVANVTERQALAAQMNPTPQRPLYVHRRDAPHRLEWTENGEDWSGSGWDTWTGSGSGFGAGLGFAGRYQQSAGKTVRGKFVLTTSVNGLTGAATFTLPVAPHASYGAADIAIGTAMLRRGAGGSPSRTSATVCIASSNMFFVVDRVASSPTVGPGVPWTWAAGDTIAGTIEYEGA